MLQSAPEIMLLRPKIAWILSPECAYVRLHRVVSTDTSQMHTITLSEAFPIRSVFGRTILSRRYGRQKESFSKALRTAGSLHDPNKSLFTCDRLVAFYHVRIKFGTDRRRWLQWLVLRCNAGSRQQDCADKASMSNLHCWLVARMSEGLLLPLTSMASSQASGLTHFRRAPDRIAVI